MCSRLPQSRCLRAGASQRRLRLTMRPSAIAPTRSKESDRSLSGARDLRERAAAQDLAGSKKAWLSARAGWERSEVFTAGLRSRTRCADRCLAQRRLRLPTPSRRNCSAPVRPASTAMRPRWCSTLTNFAENSAICSCPPQGLLDGTVRLAYEVGREQGRWRRIAHQRYVRLTTCATTSPAIEFAWRTVFAGALKAADASLADAVTERIERLKVVVAAPDLPHIDVRKLRRVSEELVGLASGRLGQAGIAPADAGGAIAMNFRPLIGAAAAIVFFVVASHKSAPAFPLDGDQTVLPPKTELNEDALRLPREVFHSDIQGRRSRAGQARQSGFLLHPRSWALSRSAPASAARPAMSTAPAMPNCSCRRCRAVREISTPPDRCSTRRPTTACSIQCGSRVCAARVISRLTAPMAA